MQSIEMVVCATEMGHTDSNRWDFNHGVLSLNSQFASIHYHLKCQGIRDNAADNEIWLIQ